MIDLGPQYSRDDPMTARMRFHQSWYRSRVLAVPCGVGPKQHDRSFYGNMLCVEDGLRGLNFLTPEIAELAQARQAELPGGVERHRLLCNMLSSQPMCFNLLGPIALDRRLGARLIEALVDVRVERVRQVVFEHSPSPAARYLGDGTSFDGYVEVDLAGGERGFVGIETKLSEPFSPRRYALAERPLYRRWVDRSDSPWREDRRDALDAAGHNQLWRDHMLAFALRAEHSPELAFGAFVLVRHEADAKCGDAVTEYASCLREDDRSFLDRPFSDIMGRWGPIVRNTEYEPWLRGFARRYVDMSESEAAWQESSAC